MAAEAARDDVLRPRWLVGSVSALTSFLITVVAFAVVSFYFMEGVLDSETTEPVRSSLFPFPWSEVEVDPSSGVFSLTLQPGPMPLFTAALTWIATTRPWRISRSNLAGTQRQNRLA